MTRGHRFRRVHLWFRGWDGRPHCFTDLHREEHGDGLVAFHGRGALHRDGSWADTDTGMRVSILSLRRLTPVTIMAFTQCCFLSL
jgi:hypothetical protein